MRLQNLILVFVVFGMFTEQAASRPTYEQARQQLDEYIELIGKLRSNLDRTQFDLDDLQESLDYDADNIVRFVAEQIYYEQYAGAMRGAQGTLESRAGSSLDQSILLAKLLKDGGFDARIVRGRLSEAQARALLKTMTARFEAASPYADKNAYFAALKRIWTLSGEPEAVMNQLMNKRNGFELIAKHSKAVQKETEFLLETLAENDVIIGDPQAADRLIEEARDYFWVEYRPDTGQWSDAHPAFGGSETVPGAVKKEQTFADSVPPEWQHRIAFEVHIGQRLGKKVETRLLFGPWERPTANLAGVNLSYSNLPLSLVGQVNDDKLELPKSRNEVFAPVFQGNFGDGTFDLFGNSVPFDAAMSNYAAIFATDAEKLSNATSALASIGGDPSEVSTPAIALAFLKIRYVLIEPDGTETEYWRTVYAEDHAKGSDEDRFIDALGALSQRYSFSVSTGRTSAAALLDNYFATIELKRALLENVIAKTYGKNINLAGNKSSGDDMGWTGLQPLFGIFDSYNSELEFASYRHKPSLLVHRVSLPPFAVPAEQTDVVQNERRSFSTLNGGQSDAAKSLLRMGVWESISEGSLSAAEPSEKKSTHSVFERFREKKVNFQVLKPDDLRRIAALVNDPGQRDLLTSELKRGYTLILPDTRNLSGPSELYWWRVNSASGVTLGIGPTGEGINYANYTLLERVVSGAVMGGAATTGCVLIGGGIINSQRPGTVTAGDCIALGIGVGAGAFFGAGLLDGLLEGAGMGAAALVLGKLVDAWGGLD